MQSESDEIRHWLKTQCNILEETHRHALGRAICMLYDCQTNDEKVYRSTMHSNGIGFNGCDAAYLSSVAQFYKKRGYLTINQATIILKKIIKYSNQLGKIMNEKNNCSC